MKFIFPVHAPQDLIRGIESVRSTREYRWAKAAVVVQGVIGGATLAWFWRWLPPKVPLWYSTPWGSDRLAAPIFLTLPILTAFMFYALNLATVSRSGRDHPIFARVLFLISILVSVLSMYIVIRIVTLIS